MVRFLFVFLTSLFALAPGDMFDARDSTQPCRVLAKRPKPQEKANCVQLRQDETILLKIVEDPAIDYDARVEAAKKLGEMKCRKAVSRLCRMLPGSADLLTFTIVCSLGAIEDPSALPRLEK